MGRNKEAREAITDFLCVSPDLMTGQLEAVKIVMSAQLELAARGYYIGIIDGVIGPFGQHALAEFQHDQDMPQSGELDGATLARLGIAQEGGQ